MTSSPLEQAEQAEEIVDNTAARLARRPWPATPIRPGIDVSFEFFPPATAASEAALASCVDQLEPLDPTFVSVTYGAGGSSQDRTIDTLRSLSETTQMNVAGHLTCVGATKNHVDAVVDEYRSLGVRRIVALRGDAPAGTDGSAVAGGYATAADLVAGIRARHGDLDIAVAAYPEVHPKAESAAADLDALKKKFDAGADRAITQFFFDTDAFLRFLEAARSAGITQQIIPGIMPITNVANVIKFSQRCGTVVPAWLPDLFDGLDDIADVRHLVAATVAAEQCRRLAEHGVTSFHFYTMNRPELSAATCRILGVRPVSDGARRTAASA